ncbi:helix-turn-helix domain-containing protein [Fulvivirga lutimaris]|uniref:helix-turn-helix domain-containing protein n=1 Tax=Fulvivirga lutimaris TaxID=1819566 RepID=UPI0012BCB726|nr:helix-turn-helix domain-containing protein [Fulvivirga lutimaris]MTI39014.1 helix-turn-helix domain-containing protein [Fulvivirga lutimaris]
MTVLRFVLLVYALIGLFVAGGVFFRKNKTASITLTAFILLLSLEILYFLYSTSWLLIQYQISFGGYYFALGFLYGPVLWFHCRSLVGDQVNFKAKDLLHLIPMVLVFIHIWDILLMTHEDQQVYISTHFLDRIMPINYLRASHQLIYGVVLIIFNYRNRYSLTSNEKVYLMLMCTIYFISTVLVSWLTMFADNWRQFIYFYFMVDTLVFIIAYLLYTDNNFLKTLSRKYLNSSLSKSDMNRIISKIEVAFSKDELFLNRDLNLSKFAEIIDEKPHNISQTMSEVVQRNFNDHLNFFRVKHAKKLLLDSKYDHYKIESIGMEAGFNNKVTFNKAFLKYAEVTPSVYKKTNTL